METHTVIVRSEKPWEKVNEYESQGWAVRQLTAISSVWWAVVLERPRQTTITAPATFDNPEPTTFDTGKE